MRDTPTHWTDTPVRPSGYHRVEKPLCRSTFSRICTLCLITCRYPERTGTRTARCLPRVGSAASAWLGHRSIALAASSACWQNTGRVIDSSMQEVPAAQHYLASRPRLHPRCTGGKGTPFHPRQAPPSTPGAIARKRYQSATTHIDAPSICPRLILPALHHG